MLYMAPNREVRAVVGLFTFRRRTHTCLNQTGASSAPEFEKGDHGADISVRRIAGALGVKIPKPTLRGSRRQLLPPATTESVGPCLALRSAPPIYYYKVPSRVGLKMAGDGLNCMLYALLRASPPLEACLRPS